MADDFEERLKAARSEFEDDYNPKPKVQHHASANIGYEFLGYVISGGLAGFFADKYLGIAPWGIMGGIVLGFVGGVFRANARTKALQSQNAVKSAIPHGQDSAQKNSEKTD